MAAKRILLVDDSESVRSYVSAVLTDAGYEVIQAANGVQAIAQLGRHAELSAVICDVNMPTMNGLEVVRELRLGNTHPGLPIVMLTSEGGRELMERAKRSGVQAWIIKPFRAADLLATVQKLTA